MTHALAVASFPDHHHFFTQHHALEITPGIVADSEKRSRRREATLVLKPVSVGWRIDRAQAHGDDVVSHDPYSPIVVSGQPRGFVDQVDDRSVSSSSPSRRFASLSHRTAQATCTKASIAALGLSGRSPSPSYDLLTTSSLRPSRGYSDQDIPPRSSSLPLYHIASPHAMLHTSSSTSVDSDRCSSRLVFAERSPVEAKHGSAARVPARASPSFPASRLDSGIDRSPLSRTPSTSSSVQSSQSSRSRKANSRYHDDDITPYGLMMASSSAAHCLPCGALRIEPTPISKRSAQTKPFPHVLSPSPSPQGSCSSYSLRGSLKKMKRLATRRSISSLDFLSTQDDSTQSESCSPPSLALSIHGRSSESVVSTEIVTPSGDESIERGRMAVARVIGDTWEPQDLDQVIPTLRSLKVSGKIGH